MRTYHKNKKEWQLRGSPHSHALDPQHGSIAAEWTLQMAAQLQHRCCGVYQQRYQMPANQGPLPYGAPGSAEYSRNG
jgi:hypothetical protein